ncbi:MAG: hypothetical protein Q4P28_04210 [Tissierellia bacterium]|nr:hypothetical protein [Tissierellia bacterium]
MKRESLKRTLLVYNNNGTYIDYYRSNIEIINIEGLLEIPSADLSLFLQLGFRLDDLAKRMEVLDLNPYDNRSWISATNSLIHSGAIVHLMKEIEMENNISMEGFKIAAQKHLFDLFKMRTKELLEGVKGRLETQLPERVIRTKKLDQLYRRFLNYCGEEMYLEDYFSKNNDHLRIMDQLRNQGWSYRHIRERMQDLGFARKNENTIYFTLELIQQQLFLENYFKHNGKDGRRFKVFKEIYDHNKKQKELDIENKNYFFIPFEDDDPLWEKDPQFTKVLLDERTKEVYYRISEKDLDNSELLQLRDDYSLKEGDIRDEVQY